ncbi:hypothetical protein NEOKW01_0988 [Nematocida sp. AWRm80]|nr:hypothetical protein NEOKW01_0988 [Nematocida sp. AWRm80]
MKKNIKSSQLQFIIVVVLAVLRFSLASQPNTEIKRLECLSTNLDHYKQANETECKKYEKSLEYLKKLTSDTTLKIYKNTKDNVYVVASEDITKPLEIDITPELYESMYDSSKGNDFEWIPIIGNAKDLCFLNIKIDLVSLIKITEFNSKLTNLYKLYLNVLKEIFSCRINTVHVTAEPYPNNNLSNNRALEPFTNALINIFVHHQHPHLEKMPPRRILSKEEDRIILEYHARIITEPCLVRISNLTLTGLTPDLLIPIYILPSKRSIVNSLKAMRCADLSMYGTYKDFAFDIIRVTRVFQKF